MGGRWKRQVHFRISKSVTGSRQTGMMPHGSVFLTGWEPQNLWRRFIVPCGHYVSQLKAPSFMSHKIRPCWGHGIGERSVNLNMASGSFVG